MRLLYRDSEGQISLDYLLGITVFMLAFIFVFAFIPGMFAPFYSNSDEVTMSADRVAAVIVENYLATGSAGAKQPDILSSASYYQFEADMRSPASSNLTRQMLGLNRSDGSLYDLEIVVQWQNGTTIITNSSNTIGSSNVGQSKRYVLWRNDSAPAGSVDKYPGQPAIVTVRVW